MITFTIQIQQSGDMMQFDWNSPSVEAFPAEVEVARELAALLKDFRDRHNPVSKFDSDSIAPPGN